MPHQLFSGSDKLLEYLILFPKDSAWSSGSGNPIDSFHPLGVALSPKSKTLSESIKNDTKAGKTRVGNELRPKLIHQNLALNKGLFKK